MDMMLDTDRGQFDCPLCKRLSNLLVPVMSRSTTQIKGDEDNDREKREIVKNFESREGGVEGEIRSDGEVRDRRKSQTNDMLQKSNRPLGSIVAVRNIGEVRKRKTESISSDSDSTENSNNKEETLRTTHQSQRFTLSTLTKNEQGRAGDHGSGSREREGDGDGDGDGEKEGPESMSNNLSSDPPTPYSIDIERTATTYIDIDIDTSSTATRGSVSAMEVDNNFNFETDSRHKATETEGIGQVPIPQWMLWIKEPRLVKRVTAARAEGVSTQTH